MNFATFDAVKNHSDSQVPPSPTSQYYPLIPPQLLLDNRRPIRVRRHAVTHVSFPFTIQY